jgi:hypothetical protein
MIVKKKPTCIVPSKNNACEALHFELLKLLFVRFCYFWTPTRVQIPFTTSTRHSTPASHYIVACFHPPTKPQIIASNITNGSTFTINPPNNRYGSTKTLITFVIIVCSNEAAPKRSLSPDKITRLVPGKKKSCRHTPLC